MKKGMLVLASLLLVTVGLSLYVYCHHCAVDSKNALVKANVEALTKEEYQSTITAECFSSVVILTTCKVECFKCNTTWYTSPKIEHAIARNVQGACTCGNTDFSFYNE